MKQILIAVIFLFTALTHTQAAPGNIDEFKGMENFKHRFPEATEVHIKVTGEFAEVHFVWHNIRLLAYYDLDGNCLVTCRAIVPDNLPLSVQLSLKNEYAGYVITDAIEYNETVDGVSYYVTVAGPKATYLLHVSTSGTISVFKKMKN